LLKKIFISLGAYKGDSTDAFFDSKRIDKEYHLLLYEPNKQCPEILKTKYPSAEIVNKAVSDKDGEAIFYPDEQHGNIIYNETKQGYTVQTEDIDNILNRLDGFDFCIMRIDVEGSEYNIVPKMLKHPNIKKINELYIEWHKDHERGNTEQLAKGLIRNIPFVMESYFDQNDSRRVLTQHSA